MEDALELARTIHEHTILKGLPVYAGHHRADLRR
jgi:hypothetical protein